MFHSSFRLIVEGSQKISFFLVLFLGGNEQRRVEERGSILGVSPKSFWRSVHSQNPRL